MKGYILLTILLLGYIYPINADELYQVTTTRLNVREKPTGTSRAIGYVPKGNRILVVDRSNTIWYKVKINNVEGYVNSNYLQKIQVKSNLNTTDKERVNKIALGILGGLSCIGLIAAFNIKSTKPGQIVSTSDGQTFPSNLSSSTTVIIKQKSVIAAIVLTFLFGPFGMFYSTVKGALIMLLLPIISFVGFLFLYSKESDVVTPLYVIGTMIFYIVFY